jgi:integrase
VTVAGLLERWLMAGEGRFTPTALASCRSNARALARDPLGGCRVDRLVPGNVHEAIARWRRQGATTSVVSGRFRTLNAALTWTVEQRIVRWHPLAGMRAPHRPLPRRDLPVADVLALLDVAQARVDKARAHWEEHPGARRRTWWFLAEQDLLLVRLAADAGARRGELAALRVDDLDGRVLTIERAFSAASLGPTKSHQARPLTLGASTAALWHDHVQSWRERVEADGGQVGRWLFSPDPSRRLPVLPGGLGHRFARLRVAAGVEEAMMHRLRHTMASALVRDGKLLEAQQRLGHRDASTTLRNYAHALPRQDQDVADQLDRLLRRL